MKTQSPGPAHAAAAAAAANAQPLQFERLSDRAYFELGQAIGDGRLQPGARLTELGLCKSLGMGRSPVREALQRLAGDGLVHAVPNAGFYVRNVTVEDYLEEYRIRAALEAVAVTLACEKGFSDLKLAHLEHCCELMRQALAERDDRRAGEADLSFHRSLIALANSKRLDSAFNGSRIHMSSVRKSDTSRKSVGASNADKRLVAEHLDIVRALRRRDPRAAIRILDLHTERALEALGKLAAAGQGGSLSGGTTTVGALVQHQVEKP